MNLNKYQIARAFYKGVEISQIISYFTSGRIHIIDGNAQDKQRRFNYHLTNKQYEIIKSILYGSTS